MSWPGLTAVIGMSSPTMTSTPSIYQFGMMKITKTEDIILPLKLPLQEWLFISSKLIIQRVNKVIFPDRILLQDYHPRYSKVQMREDCNLARQKALWSLTGRIKPLTRLIILILGIMT